MFETRTDKEISPSKALIESDYDELLFAEVPILFTGKNADGECIVGSSVDEYYEEGIERYFHIIVSPFVFEQFKNRTVPYLDLLKTDDDIYVVDKECLSDKVKISYVKFEDIPTEYHPFPDSFCPKSI